MTLLLKDSKVHTDGIAVTFLIDTQAPHSYIQPKVLQKTKPVTSYHPNGSYLLFVDNLPFLCHEITDDNPKLDGVNVLDAYFLKTNGLFLITEDPETKKHCLPYIQISPSVVIDRETCNERKY